MRAQPGFSLVELSIVLVILGLLTGGILAGKSLIHASELRGVGTEMTRYRTAVYTFQDKYFALPGDMTNAASFWLDTTNCPNSAAPTGCNGNGDGLITLGQENDRVWQHLAYAGLVEGSFTGLRGAGSTPGINVPLSKLNPSSGYDLMYQNSAYYGRIGTYLQLGIRNASSGGYMGGPIINAEDSWNIDSKLDDGQADKGLLFAIHGAGVTGCVTNGAAAASSSYILTDTNPNCRLFYWFKY